MNNATTDALICDADEVAKVPAEAGIVGDGTQNTRTCTESGEVPSCAIPAARVSQTTSVGVRHGLALVDQLLRDRVGLNARIRAGIALMPLARVLLLTIVVAMALFGAAVGAHRGGVQILYAAVKLPLALLLTAAITTPAWYALRRALLNDSDFRRDASLVLASLALASMLAAATSPIILLGALNGISYHALVNLTAACFGVGAIGGVWFFMRGVEGVESFRRATAGTVFLVTVLLVGSQMVWVARPWMVRPQTDEVPIVRPIEGSLLEAVAISSMSMLDIYYREKASPTWRSYR